MGNTNNSITNTQGGYMVNNLYPKRIKATLYKWRSSGAGYREGYALVYSSLDESQTSLCRVRVDRDQVLCRLADNSCEHRLFRSQLTVTAKIDSIRGEWDFWKVTVVANSENQVRIDNNDELCQYHCDRDHYYKVKSKRNKNNINGVENLRCGTTWKVWHSYDIDSVTVCYCLKIHCKKKTGLCVEFDEPIRLNGPRYGRPAADLQVEYQQEVFGKPPKALTAKFETEFEGVEYVIFQPSDEAMGRNNNYIGSSNGIAINNSQNCTFAGIVPGQQILDCRNNSVPPNALPPLHNNRVPQDSSQINETQPREPSVTRGQNTQYNHCTLYYVPSNETTLSNIIGAGNRPDFHGGRVIINGHSHGHGHGHCRIDMMMMSHG